MRQYLFRLRAEHLLILLATMVTAFALSQSGAEAAQEYRRLQLEVYINDKATGLIGSFVQLADRRIAARRAEFIELGLKIAGEGNADELIVIAASRDVAYRYDEPKQKIYFTVGNERRLEKIYDASGRPASVNQARADFGSVLNYNLFTAGNDYHDSRRFLFSGTSLALEGRAFSPYGTLSQSAILRKSIDHPVESLRLDSTFAFSSQDTLTVYRVGDTVTGGLAWTRPVRIGGLQVQRNFGLRPDLVTLPLPSATGSAAVPSTLDVYVNNLKTYSQDVGAGPYQIKNLPVVTGSGVAQVVVRDASGHETVTSQPFYASSSLLAPDLLDYSVEAGLPRLSYGSPFDTYVAAPAVFASLRKGIFDWLTVESHAEGGAGLINGGVGAVTRLGASGVMSAAVATSHQNGSNGLQAYFALETNALGTRISASSQRTFGSYDDLASITARFQRSMLPLPASSFAIPQLTPAIGGSNWAPFWADARPPKQLDRITIGLPPLAFDRSATLSASFVNLVNASGASSKILSASWSRQFFSSGSVFVTAFSDFRSKRNSGVFAGLSMSFDGISTTTTASRAGGANLRFDAIKPLDEKTGSYGWRYLDNEGASAYRAAAVSYRSAVARVEAGVVNQNGGVRPTAEVDGSIATMGGGVFLANRINDAFAVVNTGVPDVSVFSENRPIGVTDSKGMLLVPSLRSYQKNKIGIDTGNLPVDAEITARQEIVAPADRSGALVEFGIRTDTRSAILVIKTPDGNVVPPGSQGQVTNGESFVVGYDGRAFVKGLKDNNTIEVVSQDRQCRAEFSYAARPGTQVVISPVVCQ